MSVRIALAAVAALTLLSTATAQAAAMRCSNEQNTCIAVCNKAVSKAQLSSCITTCGQRNAFCLKTGCWDDGAQRYCGLQRQ
ncbi:hypothetical protein MXD81_59910 [Microbacteriaceae bacterium K1510]|nr:hypothetical protein [Microbacteriaceae bacterium K1510]